MKGPLQILRNIHDREGRVVFVGNDLPSAIKRLSRVTTALNVDEAVAVLQEYQAQLRTDDELTASEVVSRLGSRKLCLVGCPEKDLGDLLDELREFGIEVQTAVGIADGSHVVFCISACHGPTPGTKRAIGSLRGKTIVPIAIVLTYSEEVDDASLRELVSVQERELLAKVLPDEMVDRLPCLLNLAPNLVTQIVELALGHRNAVKCREFPPG